VFVPSTLRLRSRLARRALSVCAPSFPRLPHLSRVLLPVLYCWLETPATRPLAARTGPCSMTTLPRPSSHDGRGMMERRPWLRWFDVMRSQEHLLRRHLSMRSSVCRGGGDDWISECSEDCCDSLKMIRTGYIIIVVVVVGVVVVVVVIVAWVV